MISLDTIGFLIKLTAHLKNPSELTAPEIVFLLLIGTLLLISFILLNKAVDKALKSPILPWEKKWW